MGMLNEVNSNDSSPFDINLDFPQLTSRPSSAGGPQGQLGNKDPDPLSFLSPSSPDQVLFVFGVKT